MHVFLHDFVGKSRLRFFAIFAALAVAMPIHAPAGPLENPQDTQSAMAAARGWLAEIDAGHYDQSYAEGCLALHNKISLDQWNTVLKALRPTMGAVVSRKEAFHTYKPDGVEGLEGECMMITFNSSFEKIPVETELVVLKREDGKWRGAGYTAQPQQDPNQAPQEAPQVEQSQTDTKIQK